MPLRLKMEHDMVQQKTEIFVFILTFTHPTLKFTSAEESRRTFDNMTQIIIGEKEGTFSFKSDKVCQPSFSMIVVILFNS